MFLNHEFYEELKSLIGENATKKLALQYGGNVIYFPKLNNEGLVKKHNDHIYRGLEFPEVRKLALSMRRDGRTGHAIIATIKKQWPNEPEKLISKSALYRFFITVGKGKLAHLGIDSNFREINE